MWCIGMRRILLSSGLGRARVLQALKFLHFMLRLGCLSLFTVEARETEMRLRGQRALLLDGEKFGPGFLGGGGVAIERSRLAKGIERLRHFGH